jgi:hypothetical protein
MGWLTAIGTFFKAWYASAILGQKITDEVHDSNQRDAGANAATVKGQGDVIQTAEQAKRVEVAMQATAANPDAPWASGVRDKYYRTDE